MSQQATQGARRLGPASRAALELLDCCPRLPADVVPQLLGSRPGATRQLLSRLRRAGLVQVETVSPGALLGGRLVRLWSLTAAGRTLRSERSPASSSAALALLPYGAPDRSFRPTLQPVPALVSTYRVLGALTAAMHPRPRLRAFELPWVRRIEFSDRQGTRSARLPAAAVLALGPGELVPVLLLPDIGTRPIASYRTVLTRLLALREARPGLEEPLLVIGVRAPGGGAARAQAWHTLLRRVATRAGVTPLRTRLLPWPEPAAAGPGTLPLARDARHIDQVLQLVARHPLLTRAQLADLLETSPGRVARLQRELLRRGWLRQIDAADRPPHAAGSILRTPRLLGLVRLTRAGAREVTRLLVPGTQAVRHQCVLGDRARAHRRLLRHLAHTIGANAVFVLLARSARTVTRRGGDDALAEWRSAAACARGRCRPDGYGCYRRGQVRYGFLLEYDRSTERAREYAAKLDAYYRYRDSGTAGRDYVGFPTVLVVTARARAEACFAHQAYLAAERRGGRPLPILFTTTQRITDHPQGILGPIWRAPGPASPGGTTMRSFWLPGGPPRGLFGVGRPAVTNLHGAWEFEA